MPRLDPTLPTSYLDCDSTGNRPNLSNISPIEWYWLWPGIKAQNRKRANRDHRRKRLAKIQKKHLVAIKSKAELKRIRMGCRWG